MARDADGVVERPPGSIPDPRDFDVPEGPKTKTWMGIVSFALGVGGWWIPGGAIAGIVLGHKGFAASARGEADYPQIALAGLVANYAVLLFFVVAVWVGWLTWDWWDNYCVDHRDQPWCMR